MSNILGEKRVLIRNVDKTDEIESIRFLPNGKIGIIFKGLNIEYAYNPANITFQELQEKPQPTEYELANQKVLEHEQKVLDTIIKSVRELLDHQVYDHVPYLSPYYGRDVNHVAEPYLNFINNPYFAKMKFAGDENSYYISEHNINKLSFELDLPKNVKIISVYSDLGKHIYDRSPSFYAKQSLGKLISIGDKMYRYNLNADLNSSITAKFNVIEKLRFNIRNGKIKELKDETPR